MASSLSCDDRNRKTASDGLDFQVASGMVSDHWRLHVINLEEMYGIDKKGRKKRKVNMQAVRELVKYATKAASFGNSPELVDSFLIAFENVRRMQSFGSFLGVEKEAEKELEQTPGDFELVGCKCG